MKVSQKVEGYWRYTWRPISNETANRLNVCNLWHVTVVSALHYSQRDISAFVFVASGVVINLCTYNDKP